MKTNVEKLQLISSDVLGCIRQNLGAASELDESEDANINKMNSNQIVRAFCVWHLGSGGWWEDFKHIYDSLEDSK